MTRYRLKGQISQAGIAWYLHLKQMIKRHTLFKQKFETNIDKNQNIKV